MGRSTHCRVVEVDVRSFEGDTTNDQGGIVSRLWVKTSNWIAEEKGASMVEYALLVVLIAIVAILAIRLAGNQVSSAFSEIGSGLQ
jgi:pilus assembly protein Flp/PilA